MGKDAPNPTIRVLLLGNAGVGKNCLESRFTTMTYPPPYNPALTLNSRRYFTLSPVHAVGDCEEPSPEGPAGPGREETNGNNNAAKNTKKLTISTERPLTSTPPDSGTPGTPVGIPDLDDTSFDDRTLVASSTTASLCSACARENNTYLVEVINYPDLQSPTVRKQVHARADYDAVLLVYDVTDAASFNSISGLHSEIPVCTRKNHREHHRRAVQHASATRSRTSGWFGGGGENEAGNTGSGEIVVGLVGNKCDVDDEDIDAHEVDAVDGVAEMTTANAGQGNTAHTEDSLLHPLYRESILYEELMAQREERQRQRQARAKARKDRLAPLTPTTPFPGDEEHNIGIHRVEDEEEEKRAAAKNDDIQKWLSISRPEAATLPLSPLSPVSSSSSRDYFGLKGTVADTRGKTTDKKAPAPKRAVATADGLMLSQALQLSVPFLETSARSGRHVELALENLVRAVLSEMGRDASGKNGPKNGKTCRHRVKEVKDLKEKGKEKQTTGGFLASPKLKRMSSKAVSSKSKAVSKDKAGSAPPTPHTPHDIDAQRPESAAMFRQVASQQVDGEATTPVEITDTIVDTTPGKTAVVTTAAVTTPVTAPAPPIQRRESVLGRMRKVFLRKSQVQPVEVVAGGTMRADIAV